MASKRISELPAATALDGSEQIPLTQAGETRRIPSDTYRKVTVNANGPNDSIVTRVNDALTAAGEGAHVWIEGDEGLIDAPIVLQDRYQRVEVSGETHLWVPNGYAQPAFQIYSSGSKSLHHPSVGGNGVLREKDDGTGLKQNWTAFELFGDNNGLNFVRLDPTFFVWYAGVGIKMRTDGTGAIHAARLAVTLMNPIVGVEFVQTNTTGNAIGRNVFDFVQTQWSGLTEYGVKNVFGQGNTFFSPVSWDPDNNTAGTPFEISANATDTLIFGSDPNLDGGLVDNGVDTVVVNPRISTYPKENHRINLSASAMEASMGSPTRTTVAFRYPTWGLADSANQGVSGFLDDDDISHGSRTMRVYLVMSNTDGNTGNVTLHARVHQPRTNHADGEWPNHEEVDLVAAGVALPTDGRPQLVDMGTFEHLTGPRELHVQPYREPGEASDDMTGSVYLWKAKLERE